MIDDVVWAAMRFVGGFCMAGMIVVTESWINERCTNQTRGQVMAFYMITNYLAAGSGQFLLPPCAIRIVRVRGAQYGAVPCHASLARVALCPYSSTLFHRRYALLYLSLTRGYFTKYVWRRKFLSPSREVFEFEYCPVGGAIEF